MADAIQLLNSAAQVTSDAFGRIDKNLTRSLEVNQQVGQFQLNMAAKAIEFAESQRFNDARITEMQFSNDLQSRRYAMEEKLMPLKVESERLRLEAAKFNFQLNKEKFDNEVFGGMISAFDKEMAYNLAKTGSVDQAKEYASYRAQWQAKVGSGEEFHGASFKKGMDGINSKYVGVVSPKEFDMGRSMLFNSLGLGKYYDELSPANQQSRIGAASSFLDTPPEKTEEWSRFNERLFDPKTELGLLYGNRDTFIRNNDSIDKYSRALDIARSNKAKIIAGGMTEKEAGAAYDDDIKYFFDEKTRAIEENRKIRTSIQNGDFKFGAEIKEVKPPEEPVVTPKDAAAQKTFVGGAPNDSDEAFVQNVRLNNNEIYNALGEKNGHLIDDATNWFLKPENWDGGEVDDKTKADWRDMVDKRLDSVQKISDVADARTTNKMLAILKKPIKIPISEMLFEDLWKSGARIAKAKNTSTKEGGVQHSNPEPFIEFGGEKSFFNSGVIDYDQMMSEINKLPRVKQKYALQDIFSALTAATLANSVNNK